MSGPDYELHKLGWRAFQDLCAVVLQETLGQTFTAFADTNDAGQDGAFHGLWAVPGDAPVTELEDFATAAMPVVVQCKFSADPSGTLAPSDLDDELAKIEELHKRGLCGGYIVLTNLRITGRTQAWFTEEVRKRGPKVAAMLPAPGSARRSRRTGTCADTSRASTGSATSRASWTSAECARRARS